MKLLIGYCLIWWICLAMIITGPPQAALAGLWIFLFMNVTIVFVGMWHSATGRRPRPPTKARRASVIDQDKHP